MKHVVLLRCARDHITRTLETSVDADSAIIGDWLRQARAWHKKQFPGCDAPLEVIRGQVATPDETMRGLDTPPVNADIPFRAKAPERDARCIFCTKQNPADPDTLHVQGEIGGRGVVCDGCVDLLHDAVRAARRARSAP